MDKRAPGHWSHWSPLQWATIAAKNPPLFIRKKWEKTRRHHLLQWCIHIYDPLLLLLLPLFSLFFNWIQWHSWGLSALCLPLLLLVADIADFFHTHTRRGEYPPHHQQEVLKEEGKTDPICTHFLLCIPDGPWENKIFLLSATISRSAYIVHGCLFILDYLYGFIKTLTKRSTVCSLCQDYFRPRLTIF
jgi:hypothetical protein